MGKPLIPQHEKLRAWGLYVKGGTYWQIAQQLGLIDRNPSTAACNARTRVFAGWELVRHLARFKRWADWNVAPSDLCGARLSTHPPEAPPPPAPPKTPFEIMLDGIGDLEQYATTHGFHNAAQGFRNMRAALRFHAAEDAREKSAQTNAKAGR